MLVDPERYEGAEAEEDIWEDKDDEGAEAEDDFSLEEKLPGYRESLGFSSFRKLYSAYPTDEEKNTDEFFNAYKATLKKL